MSEQPILCADCKLSGKCQAFDPEIECDKYYDKANQIARALDLMHRRLRASHDPIQCSKKFIETVEDILEVFKK